MWGATALKWAGPDVERILGWTRYHIDTALDYGCGQHTMADQFTQLKWVGYDPGIPERAEKPKGKFDLVVCTDVMEHVEEEFIDEVLREMVEYTTQCMFLEIACSPANDRFMSGPREGKDVHISIHSPKVWEARVRKLKGIHIQEVHALGRQIRGQWRERVKFLIEKL